MYDHLYPLERSYAPPCVQRTHNDRSHQIRSIGRKQQVPHDGPMCDLQWSDSDGICLIGFTTYDGYCVPVYYEVADAANVSIHTDTADAANDITMYRKI
jgi:hypothetical protein